MRSPSGLKATQSIGLECPRSVRYSFPLVTSQTFTVLPAEAAGKHKTVSQIVAISLILLFLVIQESAHDAPWMVQGPAIIWMVTFMTVCLTMTSGISFLWRHRKLILSL